MSQPPSFFYSGPLVGSPASARSGAWLPPIGPQTASPFSSSLPPFYLPTPLPPLLSGTFDSSSGGLNDPFSNQIMNRRYNLLIRSAPTNSNSSQRAARLKQPRRITQMAESVASGTESSAVIRNQSRLHKQFGPESISARNHRRARRREEEALAAEQRHIAITTRDRQREANRPTKIGGPSPAALAAAAAAAGRSNNSARAKLPLSSAAASVSASASTNAAARQRKQILHFLTAHSPPKHRFFAHLPRPPVLTAELARAICDEIGSDALDHLRILSAQAGQYDSLHELMQALRQSAAFEHEQRESAERQKRIPFPEQALLEGRGVGNAFDVTLHDDRADVAAASAPIGAFALEQERSIAAVSAADRDRVVSFLSSSHLFSDAPSSPELESADSDAAGEITATPREIAQLIVENGGIERTLHTLSALDGQISAVSSGATAASVASAASSSSLGFPSFQSLALALRTRRQLVAE